MIDLQAGGGWVSSSIDPDQAGWYECRYFDGDIPGRLWFDGMLWLHEPDGEVVCFGNDGDEDGNESWRAVDLPGVALVRQGHRRPGPVM